MTWMSTQVLDCLTYHRIYILFHRGVWITERISAWSFCQLGVKSFCQLWAKAFCKLGASRHWGKSTSLQFKGGIAISLNYLTESSIGLASPDSLKGVFLSKPCRWGQDINGQNFLQVVYTLIQGGNTSYVHCGRRKRWRSQSLVLLMECSATSCLIYAILAQIKEVRDISLEGSFELFTLKHYPELFENLTLL